MKIKIACIKYNGLLAGGTERWMQNLAALLNKKSFEVHYYYTGHEDENRKNFLLEHQVKTIKIHENGKKSLYGKWLETDFYEKFNENNYDIIQTAIAGEKEWPFYTFKKPVVHSIHLDYGADFSSNICHQFFLSEWLKQKNAQLGGIYEQSSVVPLGCELPQTEEDLRTELNIPQNALIAGFHQRVDDNTFSTIPLQAFSAIATCNTYFLVLGGSKKYTEQAKQLKLQNFIQLEHNSSKDYISKFLNTLDIFAHGRHDGETLGYVFVEALLHKKPCIGHKSDVSNAHKETIGCGGYFVDNVKEYSSKLQLLFEDEDIRKKFSVNGFTYAYNTYIKKQYIQDIENIYKEIYQKKFSFRCKLHYYSIKRKYNMATNVLKKILQKKLHIKVYNKIYKSINKTN